MSKELKLAIKNLAALPLERLDPQTKSAIEGVAAASAIASLERSERMEAVALRVAQTLAAGLGQPISALKHLDPQKIAQVLASCDDLI